MLIDSQARQGIDLGMSHSAPGKLVHGTRRLAAPASTARDDSLLVVDDHRTDTRRARTM